MAVESPFLPYASFRFQPIECARTPKTGNQAGPDDALDGPMILLDKVVEILYLALLDRRAGIGHNAFDGSGIGAVLVDGDLLRQAVPTAMSH